jgi:hypothetical protein
VHNLFGFGNNSNGRLGIGDSTDRLTPCLLSAFSSADVGSLSARVVAAFGGKEAGMKEDMRKANMQIALCECRHAAARKSALLKEDTHPAA